MNNAEKRLAEIRERLEKATKGPFQIRRANFPVDGAHDYAILAPSENGDWLCIAETFGRVADNIRPDSFANASLLTSSFTDLKALLEAVTVAIEALEESCICSEDWWCQACEAQQIIHAILGGE